MNDTNFHKNNHYVSRGYLKRWASPSNRVWTYRTLVSHEKVPLWKESSIVGVAYHSHLYTRIIAGGESDDIETWLDKEYESPAEEVLQKVTSEARLNPTDWKTLVRFLAAQDVRTPARLIENIKRWEKTLPDLLENTLQESVHKLELIRSGGTSLQHNKHPLAEYLPIRIKAEIEPNQQVGILKAEMVMGRGLWLFSIQHLLANTANVLLKHRWTILSPPKDMEWVTSDDPVVRLNFHKYDKYDFGGGWGSKGTEIFLPIGPKHLLYTQVGMRPPLRGTKVHRDKAEMISRFIAEHAHRMIFASKPNTDILKLRPRVVNADYFRDENTQWTKWHENQTTAERDLMG